jgi:hypothetical protein
MKWFERIVGAVVAAAGAIAVTPAEMLLVYLHRNPLHFLSELGLRASLVQLIGLALVVAGMGLIFHSFRKRPS